MRITEQNYSRLEEVITNYLDKYSYNDVKYLRKNVRYKTNQFTAFVWYIFHNVNRESNFELLRSIYKSDTGLNDSHIETALKKILRKWVKI